MTISHKHCLLFLVDEDGDTIANIQCEIRVSDGSRNVLGAGKRPVAVARVRQSDLNGVALGIITENLRATSNPQDVVYAADCIQWGDPE